MMTSPEPGVLAWRKSTRSGYQANCVELGCSAEGGRTAVRDSKHPAGPALLFAPANLAAFLADLTTRR